MKPENGWAVKYQVVKQHFSLVKLSTFQYILIIPTILECFLSYRNKIQ